MLPQRIYRLEHEELGTLDRFLAPIGRDDAGIRYEAPSPHERPTLEQQVHAAVGDLVESQCRVVAHGRGGYGLSSLKPENYRNLTLTGVAKGDTVGCSRQEERV